MTVTKNFQSAVYSLGMIMIELLYPNLSYPWASTFYTRIPKTKAKLELNKSTTIQNAVK